MRRARTRQWFVELQMGKWIVRDERDQILGQYDTRAQAEETQQYYVNKRIKVNNDLWEYNKKVAAAKERKEHMEKLMVRKLERTADVR